MAIAVNANAITTSNATRRRWGAAARRVGGGLRTGATRKTFAVAALPGARFVPGRGTGARLAATFAGARLDTGFLATDCFLAGARLATDFFAGAFAPAARGRGVRVSAPAVPARARVRAAAVPDAGAARPGASPRPRVDAAAGRFFPEPARGSRLFVKARLHFLPVAFAGCGKRAAAVSRITTGGQSGGAEVAQARGRDHPDPLRPSHDRLRRG